MERILHIDKYYTCINHMKKKFDQGGKNSFQANTVEEYALWKEETREILRNLIGLNNMETCPLEPKVLERVQITSDITREKIIIQVEPGVYMPMYVLIPEKLNEDDMKCFIAPPGHSGAGKYSIAGCYDIPAVADKIKEFNYDYGMQLAKLGYIVFCPDIRGFGERREEAMQLESEEAFLRSSCFHLAHMAEPLGQTVIGMNTWDMMRLLDYIEERKELQLGKVGCLGFSGGGMLTLWLSALDDRIGLSVISGYMYGYKDSLLELNGNCSCNYVPKLWGHVDMGDIGALLAPRPVMIQSCMEDHLNGPRGIVNTIEQVNIMKKAYQLFQVEHNLYHDICQGGHKWYDENLEEFLVMHTKYIDR
ncbi:MAG: dienelactone hydrolase family protein [Anaerocolumna sp.]